MSGADQCLPDVLVFALAVRSRGRHYKTGTAMLVKIRIEIGNPEVVGVADLFVFVYARQTERKASGVFAGFCLNFIHVERRIRHDVIAAAVEVMRVVVEGVRLVTGLDHACQSVNSHIHEAKLGVVFNLFLSVEGHGAVGVHSSGVHKIAALHEHTAAAARAIEKNSLFRLQNIDDHFYKGFRREEHTVIGCDHGSEFTEEVFINAAYDIAADIVKCAVIENTEKLRQQLVGEIRIAFRQNTCELFALRLNELHGVVDSFSEAVHRMAVFVDKTGGGNVLRQIDKVFVLCLFRQVQCTLCGKVAGLDGHYASAARGTVLQYLGFYPFKAAVRIAQENKPQHGHTVLI